MLLPLLAMLASWIAPALADEPAPAPASPPEVDEDEGDISEEDARVFNPAPPHDPIEADYGVVFFGDAGSGTRAQAGVARRVGEFCATTREARGFVSFTYSGCLFGKRTSTVATISIGLDGSRQGRYLYVQWSPFWLSQAFTVYSNSSVTGEG